MSLFFEIFGGVAGHKDDGDVEMFPYFLSGFYPVNPPADSDIHEDEVGLFFESDLDGPVSR